MFYKDRDEIERRDEEIADYIPKSYWGNTYEKKKKMLQNRTGREEVASLLTQTSRRCGVDWGCDR